MQKKAKPQLHTTVLSPADRLGAEQILHELIEIRLKIKEITLVVILTYVIRRDGKNLKEKDPVLDTMISVIQVKISNQNPNHI